MSDRKGVTINVEFDSVSFHIIDAGQGWARVEGSFELEGKTLMTLAPATIISGDSYTIQTGSRGIAPLIKVS